MSIIDGITYIIVSFVMFWVLSFMFDNILEIKKTVKEIKEEISEERKRK